jgi:cholesterol transport system auxiliary component
MMIRLILSIIFMVLTAGCAVKVPPVSTYVLTVPVAATATVHPRTQQVLLVNTMTADPGYKSDRMIYVTAPAYLRSYASHAWVAPPAQMFMPLLVERIESKQYFRAVVTPPFINATDYRLDTRLVLLQQEFMQPVSQVRCVVQALLTNSRTGHVIASRRFQAVAPAPGNNPASGVAAANQAADQISEQIAQFVVASHSR